MKFLLLLALLLAACRTPAPSAPRPTRVVRVAIEDGVDMTGWLAWQLKALLKLWPRLDGTGYQFVIDQRNPDVRVRTFDAGSACEHGGGRYVVGTPIVEVDPVCMPGAERLRYAVGHEILHWLTWRDAQWAGHLCAQSDASSDCHPTVRGVGMLSPVLPAQLDASGSPLPPPDARLSPDDLRLLRALRITR